MRIKLCIAIMLLGVLGAFGHWRGAFDEMYFSALRTAELKGTGGTVTNYSLSGTNFVAHIFTNVGATNFTVLIDSLACDVLVVAGGGGGATHHGGGGGAGGLIITNFLSLTGTTALVVGAGGAGTPSGTYPRPAASNGSNSSFGAVVAYGGGAGTPYANPTKLAGKDGGSGGGAGSGESGTNFGGSSIQTSGYGNKGGDWIRGTGENHHRASGGGGAGGAGVGGSDGLATGGVGITNDFSGVATGYAGGGGGGISIHYPGDPGSATDGGGAGVKGDPGDPSDVDATANTGGGGGGCGSYNTGKDIGGHGGSGIIIIRYLQ